MTANFPANISDLSGEVLKEQQSACRPILLEILTFKIVE